jgi:hypothetical protein
MANIINKPLPIDKAPLKGRADALKETPMGSKHTVLEFSINRILPRELKTIR